MRLPSPNEIRKQYPFPFQEQIHKQRTQGLRILQAQEKKWLFFIGPCSIHDVDAAHEYALRMQQLAKKLQHIHLFMRVFLEKPRTHKGWTGLLYDPHLDGSHDLIHGIITARKLLLELTRLQIPCVTELLEPMLVPYLEDLLSWGMIGARTSASQPHRQLASGLPFPVGFKNGIHGELDTAIYGILSAQEPHTRMQIDQKGYIAVQKTTGNPWAHLVLRGAEKRTNYAPRDIQNAIEACLSHRIMPRILIDCSHGNSKKDYTQQPHVCQAILKQIEEGNSSIFGLLLESHLFSGKQSLGSHPLHYGVSITDSCLGWSETEELLLQADGRLGKIASVQKWCSQTSTSAPLASISATL